MYTHPLANWYRSHFEKKLYGRYITFDAISLLLKKLPSHVSVQQIGTSVLHRPIHSLTIGNGEKKNIDVVTNARKRIDNNKGYF